MITEIRFSSHNLLLEIGGKEALLLERFAIGNGWVKRGGGVRESKRRAWPIGGAMVIHGAGGYDVEVQEGYFGIGDRYGGFLKVDGATLNMESIGCVRIRVCASAAGVLVGICVRWGRWRYTLLVWSEEGSVVEEWRSSEVGKLRGGYDDTPNEVLDPDAKKVIV
ncbi:hypothetical protein LOK49_LG01G01489 [Camellia lanceoleosa]|uniref:Uncharacterized protein n=1 Tax=Camellia lanceoleosa TaxID=1840588 RepID=A0ACC0J4J0_9ERIC|nr:hypothetical protein LOK49_LG01G01489 [Camellia lanceoleosa]